MGGGRFLSLPADLENEEWCLGAELTSATIKTEPVLCEVPGLTPSVSLTITPVPLEGEEPQLQSDAMVLAYFLFSCLSR